MTTLCDYQAGQAEQEAMADMTLILTMTPLISVSNPVHFHIQEVKTSCEPALKVNKYDLKEFTPSQ